MNDFPSRAREIAQELNRPDVWNLDPNEVALRLHERGSNVYEGIGESYSRFYAGLNKAILSSELMLAEADLSGYDVDAKDLIWNLKVQRRLLELSMEGAGE